MRQREIERPEYLGQLIASKMNGMVKIITGIRRCGKSYLLRITFMGIVPFLLDPHSIETL